MNHRFTLLFAATLLTTASCTESTRPISPSDEIRAQAQNMSSTSAVPDDPDEEFAVLADQVPGFGGLYYKGEQLVIYLQNEKTAKAAAPAVAAFLSRKNPGNTSRVAADVSSMSVLAGRFNYRQLITQYKRLVRNLPFNLVTLTDIDERNNRITIGARNSADVARLQQIGESLRLPSGMVEFIIAEPPTMTSNLQGAVSPRVAGSQVNIGYGVIGSCTLGYNVYFRDGTGTYDGYRYFVTASHCTDSWGVNTGVAFGQPDIGTPIGVEVADAPTFDSNANAACPAGKACRYSDAALIRYSANITWDFGRFPLVGSSSPFTISGYKSITSDDGYVDASYSYLYTGLTIAKTGRTTGKTTSTILRTCVGVEQYDAGVDTGRWLLCQFQAQNLTTGGGDSGSPVYHVDASGNMNPLLGLLWGTGYDSANGTTVLATFSPEYHVAWEIQNAMGGGWIDARAGVAALAGY